MKLIRAFIRPEKEEDVVFGLEAAGFPALTKFHVFGRGKQKGLDIGGIHYDELPKILLALVVKDEDVEKVKEIIITKAQTGYPGDGKIFISPVEEAYTIRTGEAVL
ncbi:MAG: P-II family nitrogen regulator [Hydrogenothermaceae bacterium]|nr:P-II family nitrogen regulator [Hydrogenothermaceae bacterium]